jgi:hypothetical protein
MISKKNILVVALAIVIALLVVGVGMFITNDHSIGVKNFVIGSLVSIILVLFTTAIFDTAVKLVDSLPREFVEEDSFTIPVETKTEAELEEQLELDNLVGKMSDDEFYIFLSKDKYGGVKPDREAILNLLEMIKGDPAYESKEKIIYKKLQEIK